ncbi:hypothetical protein P280DRAFT_399744 [Massarina eburnea CBS 473.64]|uniref:Uncharacterized protein n=1 Tax=Massarina eburnea CBS 473.64 TaxID=1395130 RepID=A0A6A6S2X4_9PLEO|nr:hypothetical protein P280DRAFT_399744 [Massarina eburnea CBS 473.64]
MVLVARFLYHRRGGKDNADSSSDYSTDPIEQHKTSLSRASTWSRLFVPKQQQKRGDCVPTLSAIIKAGDEGVFSSALLNSLHGSPGDIPLDFVYDAFAQELRSRPSVERSSYPSEISGFLSSKRARRTQSLRDSRDGRPELSPKAPRASLDLAEMGLSRSRSRKVSPVLISTFNVLATESGSGSPTHRLWTRELQNARYVDGRTAITVSAKELATLSIILGSPVELGKDGEKSEKQLASGGGAYGISISGTKADDGNYKISLTQHKRKTSQLPALGSGYSTLHAKHFACGSLPYSLDTTTVNTLLITNETLQNLRTGTHSQLPTTPTPTPTAQSTFLASLPHSRSPTFHTLTSTTTTTLLHAIADLPFTGGLPPLASAPLIQTIQFVTCGGLIPGRLLQRLEALVDKVHRHSPGLQLFGPLLADGNAHLLFRERERLGKVAGGGRNEELLADKVARMQRYATLIERLMALIPDLSREEVLIRVREAARKDVERAYRDAVAAFADTEDTASMSRADSKRNSTLSRRGTRKSKRFSSSTADSVGGGAAAGAAGYTSPRPSSTFPEYNLGSQIERVLKGSLPFDVETVALVVRLVIVAWTVSVGSVAWEEGEEGFRVMDGVEGEMVWR